MIHKFVNALHRLYPGVVPKHDCSGSIGPIADKVEKRNMICSKCIISHFVKTIPLTKDGFIDVPDPRSICIALLEYGKLFSANIISTIDDKSHDELKKGIIYAPSSLASKFIASTVSEHARLGLSITKERGIQFTTQTISDRIEAAGYILLHHTLQVTKLCSLVIKGVSLINGAIYLPLPRIINLDPARGPLSFVAMFPPQMRERYTSVTGKPIEYIGRLRYTIEGLDTPTCYAQIATYLVYHYTRMLKDPDYGIKHAGDKILLSKSIRSFMERGSFKTMGAGNSIGLVECQIRGAGAFPKYFDSYYNRQRV